MECIGKNDRSRYDEARKIGNARFNYEPHCICYCCDENDVIEAMKKAKTNGLGVRIRSGGHQHEGMCSADDVVIIDLSKICKVDFDLPPGSHSAWIGAGARLECVYDEMCAAGWLFPGGGCGNVRVGGLVQGGGWGPFVRQLGLTSDSLIGFTIVTAGTDKKDPRELHVTDAEDDKNRDMFWAVRSGGGGNFGVITKFRFTLTKRTTAITRFTIRWQEKKLIAPVVEEWRKNFTNQENLELSSFCRLMVNKGNQEPPVRIGGFFLGAKKTLKDILPKLLPKTWSHKSGDVEYEAICPAPGEGIGMPANLGALFTHPEYQAGPPMLEGQGGPTDTCAGTPYPHKVSSSFPVDAFDYEGVQAMANYIGNDPEWPSDRASLYLSLHCLGGAVIQKDNCGGSQGPFPFRDKPFILQYQAWWNKAVDETNCIGWIKAFRTAMKNYTEGAFINFPDKDLVEDSDRDRKALLRNYYRENLEELIRIKGDYDPNNVFDFGMSIPPH